MIRELSRRQLAIDVGIATLLALPAIGLSLLGMNVRGTNAFFEVILTIAMALAFGLRRLSPSLALAVAWSGAIVQMVAGLPPLLQNTAIFAVLFSTSRYGSRALRWAGFTSAIVGGVTIGLYLFASAIPQLGHDPGMAVPIIMMAVASVFVLLLTWTLGLLARSARYGREQREAGRLAELSRRRAEQQAIVEQERNRIARDMHDVVAHSLAVVIAQADGARYAQLGNEEAVAGTLETISDTARSALGEVRVLLAELRHDQLSGPQPTVGELSSLFAQMRGAGMLLDIAETGTAPAHMPVTHQMAIYRIVQESLTNALRHGTPGAPVRVEVVWRTDGVGIAIENSVNLSRTPQTSTGHGLPGMRERATLSGGWLNAMPAGTDRFRVTAFIPLVSTARPPYAP